MTTRERSRVRMSWERFLSRPSHRHCRHRCERPLRMDAPSTGWVTALAGLLARGSSLSCVRPSRFPSGRIGRGLAAYSCGGSHGFLRIRQGRTRSVRVPSFVPGADPGNQHVKMFSPTRARVKRRRCMHARLLVRAIFGDQAAVLLSRAILALAGCLTVLHMLHMLEVLGMFHMLHVFHLLDRVMPGLLDHASRRSWLPVLAASAFAAGWLVVAGAVGGALRQHRAGDQAHRDDGGRELSSTWSLSSSRTGLPRTLGLFGRPAWRRSLPPGCAQALEPALKRAVIARSNSGTGRCRKAGGIVTRLNFS